MICVLRMGDGIVEKQIVCPQCESILAYHRQDMLQDNNEDYYIVCPICSNKIIFKKDIDKNKYWFLEDFKLIDEDNNETFNNYIN